MFLGFQIMLPVSEKEVLSDMLFMISIGYNKIFEIGKHQYIIG